MTAVAVSPAPDLAGRWLIYGANGFTGRLVAAVARDRGLEPIVAGRSEGSVKALGEELGLPWRAFPLGDPRSLRVQLADVDAVLSCAGPFIDTHEPLVAACLDSHTHYLDITGEIGVFERVLACSAEAEEAGVSLLPGVGFDVVPTDCLAVRLATELPGAVKLTLAFAADGGSWSAGTMKTMIEGLPHLGAERRDGRIVPLPPAHDERTIPFSDRPRQAVPVPWGDVSTAYHSTGIPNIRVYTALPPKMIRNLRRFRMLLPVLGLGPIKRFLQRRVERRVSGPDEEARRSARMHVWGRVENAAGAAVSATLDTPEGYTFTADAAVECVRRLLAGEVAPGAWTPAEAFGADLVDRLGAVEIGPLVREEALAAAPEPTAPVSG